MKYHLLHRSCGNFLFQQGARKYGVLQGNTLGRLLFIFKCLSFANLDFTTIASLTSIEKSLSGEFYNMLYQSQAIPLLHHLQKVLKQGLSVL